MIYLHFGLAFWMVFSLFFFYAIIDLEFYHDDLIKAAVAFYKSLRRRVNSFNIFGKIFSYIICTAVALPAILLHYILFIPFVLIIWFLLNIFFWLATLKLKKDKTTKWTSTDKTE